MVQEQQRRIVFPIPPPGLGVTSQATHYQRFLIKKKYTTGRMLFDGTATCNGLWYTAHKAWITGTERYKLYTHLEGYSFRPWPFWIRLSLVCRTNVGPSKKRDSILRSD